MHTDVQHRMGDFLCVFRDFEFAAKGYDIAHCQAVLVHMPYMVPDALTQVMAC